MGEDRLCGARGEQNPGELAPLKQGRAYILDLLLIMCRTCDLTSLTFSFHILQM